MNPNENNPSSPMGAGGAAPVPGAGAPLDFTNPTTLENGGMGPSSVSDAQSMSTPDTSSTNIDGTMNNNISPTTLPPLTPAEPVPGSIGSVTSVPPLAPEPMDMGAFGGNAAGATTSNMPVMGQAPESKPAAGNNESPYYNPFLRNNVNNESVAGASAATTNPAPSSAPMAGNAPVPSAAQPKVEDKFAERLKKSAEAKKPSNVMTLLGWLLAVLFAVVAIVMGILWWGEKNKKPQVVYVPATEQDETQNPDEGGNEGNIDNPGVVGATVVLKCTMESGVDGGEEMPGLINTVSDATMNYSENGLVDMGLNVGYVFTDADAATASKPMVDTVDAMLAGIMTEAGTAIFTHGVSQIDNTVNFGVSADAATIVSNASLADMFKIPTAEDGTRNTTIDALRGVYEAEGFVCTTE